MDKIDIQTLGEVITEYREGKPFASRIDPIEASRTLATKLNEVIEYISKEGNK